MYFIFWQFPIDVIPNLTKSKFQNSLPQIFFQFNSIRLVLPWKVGLSPNKCSVYFVSSHIFGPLHQLRVTFQHNKIKK